jgi:flagellar motility protein MotE (MotC chaperone)
MRPRPTPARPVPRMPILPLLASMLILGAGLRILSASGAALAQAARPVPTDNSVQALPPAAPDIPSLTVTLVARERALEQRARDLDARAAELAMAEARIAAQITALQEAESALAATLALAERGAEDDLARMVAVFENMRADDAARVFAEMDQGFAAGFIARLRPETAASVLAGLDPARAYALSALVAGRNAGAPRN